jgi:agmatine deiminase
MEYLTQHFKYRFIMPPEWSQHRATWICWPHFEEDFPGKVQSLHWVYTELVRLLVKSEKVEILCDNLQLAELATEQLHRSGILTGYDLHIFRNDRSWSRDNLPTLVFSENNQRYWINWQFNGWAKYDNHSEDSKLGQIVADVSQLSLIKPLRPDNGEPLVLEGGAFDVDGSGLVMVTEECLLSTEQNRNCGMSRQDYETAFNCYLGASETIWLGSGCAGDDTHGHIDDIARFVAPATVLLAFENDENNINYQSSQDNYQRLKGFTTKGGKKLEVIKLPYPETLICDEQNLPASYANFYISNKIVVVPTFNDVNDRIALDIISKCFPTRKIIGLHAVDFVLGWGTVHCSTQQEPSDRF